MAEGGISNEPRRVLLVTGGECQGIHSLLRGTLSHIELYDMLSRDESSMSFKMSTSCCCSKAANCWWQWTKHHRGTPRLKTPNMRHTAPGTSLASRPSGVLSTTAKFGTMTTQKITSASSHSTHVGHLPSVLDIESTGRQGNKLIFLQLLREFQGICGADKSS